MPIERHIRLFRNGRNQALRIPREFEIEGNEAIIRKKSNRLIVEPVVRGSRLIVLLKSLKPIDDEGPLEIDDPPAVDEHHGEIRAHLSRLGQPIGWWIGYSVTGYGGQFYSTYAKYKNVLL